MLNAQRDDEQAGPGVSQLAGHDSIVEHRSRSLLKSFWDSFLNSLWGDVRIRAARLTFNFIFAF